MHQHSTSLFHIMVFVMYLYSVNILWCACVCVCMNTCHSLKVEVRGKFCEIGSLLLYLNVFLGSNSAHQLIFIELTPWLGSESFLYKKYSVYLSTLHHTDFYLHCTRHLVDTTIPLVLIPTWLSESTDPCWQCYTETKNLYILHTTT